MKRFLKCLILAIVFGKSLVAMEEINGWADLEKFAGKAVAYKTVSLHICGSKNYELGLESEIKYGVISQNPSLWRADCEGYLLSRIVKPKSRPARHPLVDPLIGATELFMRLLTEEEKILLKKAIRSGHAKIELVFDKDEAISLIV